MDDDDDDIDFEEARRLKRAVPLSSTAVQHSFGRGKGCIEKLLSQLVLPQATMHTSVLRCGGGGARDGDSGVVARCGKMRGLTTSSKPKISGRARVLMRGHVEERKPGSCRSECRWVDLLSPRDENTKPDENVPDWTNKSTLVLYPVASGVTAKQLQQTLMQFGAVTHCVLHAAKDISYAYVRMQQEHECDQAIAGVHEVLGSDMHCTYVLK